MRLSAPSSVSAKAGIALGLNLADCFSYALAKSRDLPLLFKGNDFANTDIAPAWSG